MGDLIPLLGIFMVFSIPLSAIIGGYYLKLQKLKSNGIGLSKSEISVIKSIAADSHNFQQRLENLELIVSDLDNKKLLNNDNDEVKLKVDYILAELKNLKQQKAKASSAI